MEKQPTASLIKHFEELPDPRTGNAKTHIFLEIGLVSCLSAFITSPFIFTKPIAIDLILDTGMVSK